MDVVPSAPTSSTAPLVVLPVPGVRTTEPPVPAVLAPPVRLTAPPVVPTPLVVPPKKATLPGAALVLLPATMDTWPLAAPILLSVVSSMLVPPTMLTVPADDDSFMDVPATMLV